MLFPPAALRAADFPVLLNTEMLFLSESGLNTPKLVTHPQQSQTHSNGADGAVKTPHQELHKASPQEDCWSSVPQHRALGNAPFSYLNSHSNSEQSLWFPWVTLILPTRADPATHLHLVIEPLTVTLWVRPHSQFLIQWVVRVSNPCLSSLETRVSCRTVLNAFFLYQQGLAKFYFLRLTKRK